MTPIVGEIGYKGGMPMPLKQLLEESRQRETTVREDIDSLGDDDVMDTLNLTKDDTGINGIVFISTHMGAHGPRIKYMQKPGEHQPSFSVSISDRPRVLATSLPDRVVNRMAPAVIEWVRANRDDLLKFWNSGNDLTRAEVNQLLDGLEKLPLR